MNCIKKSVLYEVVKHKFKRSALILVVFIAISCNHSAPKDKMNTAKKYFIALNESSSSKINDLISDSLLMKIPNYDYKVAYSKNDYIEKWLKWDSVFQPSYKILALHEENGNVNATISKADQRISFFMHKPFLTQETLRFREGKIAVIETKYVNFDERTWAENREKLLNWVERNHPEYQNFINDQTEAGGLKFLEVLNEYKDSE